LGGYLDETSQQVMNRDTSTSRGKKPFLCSDLRGVLFFDLGYSTSQWPLSKENFNNLNVNGGTGFLI
jgi:hypothetical protein